MERIVTISREFGSGGREIGYRLAARLGIPFYDSEIISLAAENTNIAEEVFHAHDEVIIDSDHTNGYRSILPDSNLYEIPVSDQLFVAQSQVIKRLAMAGPCVIIGRCSDMILEGSFNVFICSNIKNRIERLARLEPETDIRTIETNIRRIDGKRRDYYQYYSGNEWGNPRNYHVCINSGKFGVEGCVQVLQRMLEIIPDLG